MLRSAAMAGAGSADAATNANAAVLAHSEVLIPNLNSTDFALAATHRRGPAGGPSTGEAGQQIFGECGASATEFHLPHSGRAANDQSYGLGQSHSRRLFSQSSRYL